MFISDILISSVFMELELMISKLCDVMTKLNKNLIGTLLIIDQTMSITERKS